MIYEINLSKQVYNKFNIYNYIFYFMIYFNVYK